MTTDTVTVREIVPDLPASVADLYPGTGSAAWYGPDMAKRAGEWTYTLSSTEVVEIERAAAGVLARHLDIVRIRPKDVPLPTLGPVLAEMRQEILHGQGFCLIRGLPVERWSREQVGAAYFSLGVHLGEPVSQNAKGHALGHVKDLGFDYSLPTARGYQTAARLPYHCDAADVVGLLCLKPARSGGLSSIVSSVTLYEEMRRRRPDLVLVLTRPVYRDRRGEVPKGRKEWYTIPVFNLNRGRILTSYVRSTVRKSQRHPEVPRLTPEQVEAMDMLDVLAEDPALHLDMEFRPGDVQLLNNHTILHSRTAFEDFPEPENRRHLLRLWLACPGGPPLPDVYRNYQGLTEAGRPNGFLLDGVRLIAPLDAIDGGPGESALRQAAGRASVE